MEASSYTVLGISGSLREASFNRLLLDCADAVAPEGVAFDAFTELSSVPLFNQDSEGDRTPPVIHDLRARIAGADAVLIATPEYNSSSRPSTAWSASASPLPADLRTGRTARRPGEIPAVRTAR